VGTVLAGQFEIEGKIGRGAVATVYAARDVELDEAIALKAIPTFGNTEAAKRAVLPEYKAVRSLKSGGEHILHIDRPMVCTHAGMDWVLLPMERAEGSFRDWLEETKTDPGVEKRLEEGLTLLRQACRGVEALHAEGLAHMDLKPENLLLVRDEGSSSEETEWTVKIADFGLARSLRRGEVLNQEVVAEGVGTPYYMAPEQIRAARQKEVGEEADIYSLGVMLFELIDGDRPFDGTAERVREKHRKVDPPSVRTALPGRLEEVAHACLRKEAGDRPLGAGKIREALTLETSEERAAFERAREAKETAAGDREVASAEPNEAARRRVRRALEQENLQPIEESLREGARDVRAALEDEAESLDADRKGMLLRQTAEEDLPGVARALLEAEADPNASDEDGKAPLHVAAKKGAVEVAETLLEEWADPSVDTEEGQTPFHYAASSEEAETLTNMFLEEGADVNAPISDGPGQGQTPLHGAALMGNPGAAEVLLENGARVGAADENGQTPLHKAALLGNPEVAEVLLKEGADVNARTSHRRKTPLDKSDEDSEVAHLLRRNGGKKAEDLTNRDDPDNPTFVPLDYSCETTQSDESSSGDPDPTTITDEPGPDEYVTVRNNQTDETREMKWKYAKKKIKRGWTLVS
jgi:serine/threonine protein kinase